MSERELELIHDTTVLISAKPDLSKIKEMLADDNLALNVRWDCYVKLVKAEVLTDKVTYGDGHVSLLKAEGSPDMEITLYDDFFIERYETISYTDFADRINDNDYGHEWTEDSVDAWKREVLKTSNAMFTHDW